MKYKSFYDILIESIAKRIEEITSKKFVKYDNELYILDDLFNTMLCSSKEISKDDFCIILSNYNSLYDVLPLYVKEQVVIK